MAIEQNVSFLMRYGQWSIDMTCTIDVLSGSVVDFRTSDPEDSDLMSAYIKVRRQERAGGPRQHDARLVSSRVDLVDGKIECVMELSDIFVPLSCFARAAGEYAYKNNLSVVSILAADVASRAIEIHSY